VRRHRIPARIAAGGGVIRAAAAGREATRRGVFLVIFDAAQAVGSGKK